ncbi:hypothetical protein HGRIS_009164 [Hohenbuehelia grisea]|uniref:Uncharacterized protein n=1 Tax=Hohenbuehelia grisea TaxID=104357 RepID=A0ABR3J095_9AGAR
MLRVFFVPHDNFIIQPVMENSGISPRNFRAAGFSRQGDTFTRPRVAADSSFGGGTDSFRGGSSGSGSKGSGTGGFGSGGSRLSSAGDRSDDGDSRGSGSFGFGGDRTDKSDSEGGDSSRSGSSGSGSGSFGFGGDGTGRSNSDSNQRTSGQRTSGFSPTAANDVQSPRTRNRSDIQTGSTGAASVLPSEFQTPAQMAAAQPTSDETALGGSRTAETTLTMTQTTLITQLAVSTSSSVTPDPSAQSDAGLNRHSVSRAVAIGIGMAIVSFLLLAAAVWFLRGRRRRRQQKRQLDPLEKHLPSAYSGGSWTSIYLDTELGRISEEDESDRSIETNHHQDSSWYRNRSWKSWGSSRRTGRGRDVGIPERSLLEGREVAEKGKADAIETWTLTAGVTAEKPKRHLQSLSTSSCGTEPRSICIPRPARLAVGNSRRHKPVLSGSVEESDGWLADHDDDGISVTTDSHHNVQRFSRLLCLNGGGVADRLR